jgi:hypothetical protein
MKMGYFVACGPSPWRKLWPFNLRKTRPPRLLTVAGLIKAGDEGIFTSSMFDGISANHEQVSWKALYEAFFREYAWTSQRLGILAPLQERKDEDLRRFRLKAAEDVRKLMANAEIAYHTFEPVRLRHNQQSILGESVRIITCSRRNRDTRRV